MGYIDWLGNYETSESVIVTLLRKAGAIFYVKTSVPQTLMVCETVNNVIGRTVNPRNNNWSCGGSSGGEGAIIGIRGGVIGVGTDIGMFAFLNKPLSGLLVDLSRRLHSRSVSVQLPLRYSSQSWSIAICATRKQYGGSGNGP